ELVPVLRAEDIVERVAALGGRGPVRAREQVHVVVAEHRLRAVFARPPEHVGAARPAVDEVAAEDDPVAPARPAQTARQLVQRAVAPLNVPHDPGRHQPAAAGRIASGGTSGAAAWRSTCGARSPRLAASRSIICTRTGAALMSTGE